MTEKRSTLNKECPFLPGRSSLRWRLCPEIPCWLVSVRSYVRILSPISFSRAGFHLSPEDRMELSSVHLRPRLYKTEVQMLSGLGLGGSEKSLLPSRLVRECGAEATLALGAQPGGRGLQGLPHSERATGVSPAATARWDRWFAGLHHLSCWRQPPRRVTGRQLVRLCGSFP